MTVLTVAGFFTLYFQFDILNRDNSDKYTVLLVVSLGLAWLIYVLFCVVLDRIPHASYGSLGVLFEIDAETDKIYESVKYNLVGTFKDIISQHATDAVRFEAICVPRKTIQQYQDKGSNAVVKLLSKTNCIMLVDIRYKVDDTTRAENFEMTANYGIRHPEFSKEVDRILIEDMHALNKPFEKQRFKSENKIDVFNFTAQSLSYICRYMLGMVCLLSDDYESARVIFTELGQALSQLLVAPKPLSALAVLTKKRLFTAYILMSGSDAYKFEETSDLSYLETARCALETANSLYPDTYSYCIGMAYILVALNQDAKTAKAYIDKCKVVQYDYRWMFSDAFLSAYLDYAPMTICSKYKKAFEVSGHNPIQLISYTEYVIATQPDHMALYLAAGLMYENIGDAKQAKSHFQKYLDFIGNSKGSRIVAHLKKKMTALPCNIECDNQCSQCDEQ